MNEGDPMDNFLDNFLTKIKDLKEQLLIVANEILPDSTLM